MGRKKETGEEESEHHPDAPLSAASETIRVLIADDHGTAREGLCRALAIEGDIEVVAAVHGSCRIRTHVERFRPHVCVIDVTSSSGDGLGLLESIKAVPHAPRVLVLSLLLEPELIFQVFRRRAEGFLPKDSRVADIAGAIRDIAAGRRVWDGEIGTRLLDAIDRLDRPLSPGPLSRLSYREHRIVRGIAAGLTNPQIGRELHLSDMTVRNYVSQIMQRVGVKRRAELAFLYARDLS